MGDGVKTPTGFKEAYQQYVEGGWPSMTADPNYGGQGLPHSLGLVMSEMVGTANWSFGMYPGLSHGATNTIEEHGTAEPNADGTYAITGTKIFISAGEHDMAENIVHIV